MIKIDTHKVNILVKIISGIGSAIFILLLPALFALSTTKITRFIGIATGHLITLGEWLLKFLILLIILLGIWLFIILWINFKNNIDLQQENEKIKSKANNLEEDYAKVKSNREGLKQEIKAKKKEINQLRHANEFASIHYEQLIHQQATIIAAQLEVIKSFKNENQTTKKLN
ncbi:hypothetical protein [Weissella paramesenteroides]|uniref:hypothetical protein n=1 Tax=Weissella paramesenteroides TaxID=1249 RepID=UPI00388FD5FA